MNDMISLLLFGVGAVALVQDLPPTNLGIREVLVIPREKKDWLVGVQNAIVLKDGSFLVSDKLDYTLKKFSARGTLKSKTGRRGKGPGEFMGPGPLAEGDTVVAVADFASSRIQLFSAGLEFKSVLHVDGSVFDICFDREGYLWVGLLSGSQRENLVQLNLKGKPIRTITLRNTSKDLFDNMFWFTIDKNNEIIVAYVAQNKVELWNTLGEFKKDFEVPGLPLRSRRRSISKRIFSEDLEVPEDNIFWDIGVNSRGNIFLLADKYTPNPDQDVYVVNKEGHLLSLVRLPERAMTLFVDSRDRLLVTDIGKTSLRLFEFVRTNQSWKVQKR